MLDHRDAGFTGLASGVVRLVRVGDTGAPEDEHGEEKDE